MSFLNSLLIKTIPFVPKPFIWSVAKKYIAGKNLNDVARTVRTLNSLNALATIDVLGEDVFKTAETFVFRDSCIETLKTIYVQKLDSNLSLKLTQLGLKIDKSLCEENLREILTVASQFSIFTRIDMEDSSCTDDTLEIFGNVKKNFPNVGIVIQAYLRRSESDIKQLVSEKANVRLCKGIYIESEEIAFKDRVEIQENYLKLLEMLLSTKTYMGIATHDSHLIESAYSLIKKYNLQNSEFEFQMLLGVRRDLRNQIIANGNKIRIYVPYGEHWYAYSIRRMKENPELAENIFKSFFGIYK